jgi:hypothetical protein
MADFPPFWILIARVHWGKSTVNAAFQAKRRIDIYYRLVRDSADQLQIFIIGPDETLTVSSDTIVPAVSLIT